MSEPDVLDRADDYLARFARFDTTLPGHPRLIEDLAAALREARARTAELDQLLVWGANHDLVVLASSIEWTIQDDAGDRYYTREVHDGTAADIVRAIAAACGSETKLDCREENLADDAGQTRLGSLVESVLNTVIGFGVAQASQLALFPLFGIDVTLRTNLALGAWFTAISVCRSYFVRRFFNARLHAAAEAIARRAREG